MQFFIFQRFDMLWLLEVDIVHHSTPNISTNLEKKSNIHHVPPCKPAPCLRSGGVRGFSRSRIPANKETNSKPLWNICNLLERNVTKTYKDQQRPTKTTRGICGIVKQHQAANDCRTLHFDRTKHEETHEKLEKLMLMYQLPVLMDFGSQLLGPSPPVQSAISGGKMLVIYGDMICRNSV